MNDIDISRAVLESSGMPVENLTRIFDTSHIW
jgi:hypothetical protein